MATENWTNQCKQSLWDSELTLSQKLSCVNVMDSLGEMESQLTTDVLDGDYRVTVNATADTIQNQLQWVKKSFRDRGVSEITVRMNENGTSGTVVVRADPASMEDRNTDDNTTPEASNGAGAPATPPTNPTTSIQPETKTDTTAEAPKSTGLATEQSDEAKRSVAQNVPNTSEFYLNTIVMLEGVQVPHNSVTVSYGLASPPSCTIIIPASSIIRDLPETTKVHVFFEDLLPDDSGEYKWRLLFDGEMAGYQYNVDSNGATMSISAIHSSAYTTLMQLLTLDAAEYLFNPNPRLVGDATMPMVFGQNKISTKLISNIMNGKSYESMADIVYQLMRSIINGTLDSAVGKYYHAKLGDEKDGWKILKRIYGVSKATANSPLPRYDSQYSSKSGGGGVIPKSNGAGNDKIVAAGQTYLYNTGRDTTVDGIENFECDGYVTASLRKAGCEPAGWPEHWVPSQMEYLQNKGWWSTDASNVQPGDIIYLNGDTHTGLFMRDESGKGFLIHNSSSKQESVAQEWEPPGFDGLDYVGHGRVPG